MRLLYPSSDSDNLVFSDNIFLFSSDTSLAINRADLFLEMCVSGVRECVCVSVWVFRYVIILLLFVWSNRCESDLAMTTLVSICLPFINEVSVIETRLPRLDHLRLSAA